jgi:filamentous hemagglutinin family protein
MPLRGHTVLIRFGTASLTVLAAAVTSQLLLLAKLSIPVQAQVAPITTSGLNTQISTPINNPVGQVQYNITGGTRPANGPNLFHSFGEFGVPTNTIANFLNETALPTANILSRVTGGNPSTVFGTLQTTGFGNANLFLMNPAGIVFGPNAVLNVGGSVSSTTADYLRLADGGQFNAIPAPQDATISSSPVAAFGFLGSNPAALTIQGSRLAVSEGQAILLVGGNITVEGTSDNVQPAHNLSAPGGQISLASVASPGEVLATNLQFAPNINGQSFTNMGDITLSNGSKLNVSANASGTIKIRGGHLVIDHASMAADTANATGASIAIDINTTEGMFISAVDAPTLTARTTGAGNAGEVRVSSDKIDISGAAVDSFLYSIIDTHTSGSGNAGHVSIAADDLTVKGDPSGGLTLFIESGTSGVNPGRGGNVTITARTVETHDTSISTGNLSAFLLGEGGAGAAGDVSLTADSVKMTLSQIITDSFDFEQQLGRAGDITARAHSMTLDNSAFSSAGQERGGDISVTAKQLFAVNSQLVTQTNLTSGGKVAVTGDVIELTNGSSVVSSTGGDGHAGPITIRASDHIGLLRGSLSDRPSGIFSNSFGTFGTLGNAGDIALITPRLEITGGARINTTTATSGRGGKVTIHATDSISMSGETGGFSPEPLFSLGSLQPSGIFTLTIGGNCSGPCGNAGNVSISTSALTMGSGAQINSGTSSTGQGGNISINVQDTIFINGRLSNGQPAGMLSRTVATTSDSGQGGDISLSAGQSVTLSNGAAISASSTGPANAGNIAINAGAQFLSQNAAVTTEASQASGGNILIQATDSIRLVNGQINTSVQGGPFTSGGNIILDPAVVTLQNSQVLAQAVQGQGGNINITAGTFLADPASIVSASSQFGLSGTVTIQSPVSSLSNTLATLPQRPLQAQPLLRQRCAAQLDGHLSSFVVAGRDALPHEPGGWLLSPLTAIADNTHGPQALGVPHHGYEQPAREQAQAGESPSWRSNGDPEGCRS